jgi:hypothetical protein
MFNQGSTLTRVFRITKQHLELQYRLVAMTRFLVQLTAIVDQSGHGTLGFLTTLDSHDLDLIPDGPTSKGGILHAEGLR